MNNSRFWTSGDISRWCAGQVCTLTMYKTDCITSTHRLFFVASSASCWQPGGPDPAAEDLYAGHPSALEPWPQLHRQVCHFLTFEILSPQSLVQTVDVSNKWINVFFIFFIANNLKTSQSRSSGLLVPRGPAHLPWIQHHLLNVARSPDALHLGHPESFHCFPCRIPFGHQHTSSPLKHKVLKFRFCFFFFKLNRQKQNHFTRDLTVIPTWNCTAEDEEWNEESNHQ